MLFVGPAGVVRDGKKLTVFLLLFFRGHILSLVMVSGGGWKEMERACGNGSGGKKRRRRRW